MRVVQITALCARRWRNWISGRDLGRQHQNCLSTDLTRAAGLSCRGDRNPLLYRQAKFPMAIRWRLRPSSSIFAPFWDSAKRIRWVAGMASATLAGGSHKTDFRNRKPETWNSAVRSQFAGLGSQVSGLRPQVRSQISDFRFQISDFGVLRCKVSRLIFFPCSRMVDTMSNAKARARRPSSRDTRGLERCLTETRKDFSSA